MMLIVHVPKLTNRVGYTLKVLLHTVLHLDFEITTDETIFQLSDGAKLCYGPERIGDALWIKNNHLLFQTGVNYQELSCFDYNGSKAFFPIRDKKADFPFDLLAATFYVITRYEEMYPCHLDQHGRFMASESMAYANGFLQDPVVDQWAVLIADQLQRRYPSFQVPSRRFTFVPTIDIDEAYCYKNKGFIRNVLAAGRDILKTRELGVVKRRLRVLRGIDTDPYDTFDQILAIKEKYHGIPLTFFALVGNYGAYDKNIAHTSTEFQLLLKHLGDYAHIGLHTSYAGFDDPKQMDLEKSRLEDIMNQKIKHNRDHFLRLQLPETYRRLIHAGITDDYTMGYPDEPGFRAGISVPYPFFNLRSDSEMNLTVHPFVVMDTTLHNYKKKTAAESLETIKQLMDKVAKVNGSFCGIWHNQNLGSINGWDQWMPVFEEVWAYGDQLRHASSDPQEHPVGK